MKRRYRIGLLLVVLLSLGAAAVSAQDESYLLDWVPAGSAGFVSVRHDDDMLAVLGLSLETARFLQPARIDVGDSVDIEDFFPIGLFDLEAFDFGQLILPWLGDEMLFVYGNLNPDFTLSDADFLWLFKTDDAFAALAALQPVLEGQDNNLFAEPENYKGITIYDGDKAALAVAPNAVLVGSPTMLRAAIDAALGDSERLVSGLTYVQVRAEAPPDAPLFAYLEGDHAARALSVLLGGGDAALPLLNALGQAVNDANRGNTLASALLTGDVDAISMVVSPDIAGLENVHAVVTVHTQLTSPVDSPDVSGEILAFIPRSAAIVQSGSDATTAAYTTLLALPLANYLGTLAGQFPLPVTDSPITEIAPLPSGMDLRSALEGFTQALNEISAYDLEDDLLNHLDGSYAVVVIPRPNAPTPLLNTPYDLLILAQVDDADTARAGVVALVEAYLGADLFEDESLAGETFAVIRQPRSQETVLSVGVVDDVLALGTGTAVALALDAQAGDNRLIDQPRWQTLSAERAPQLYIDINPYFNLLAPQAGGGQPLPFLQLGVNSRYLGDGMYELDVLVTLVGR